MRGWIDYIHVWLLKGGMTGYALAGLHVIVTTLDFIGLAATIMWRTQACVCRGRYTGTHGNGQLECD